MAFFVAEQPKGSRVASLGAFSYMEAGNIIVASDTRGTGERRGPESVNIMTLMYIPRNKRRRGMQDTHIFCLSSDKLTLRCCQSFSRYHLIEVLHSNHITFRHPPRVFIFLQSLLCIMNIAHSNMYICSTLTSRVTVVFPGGRGEVPRAPPPATRREGEAAGERLDPARSR